MLRSTNPSEQSRLNEEIYGFCRYDKLNEAELLSVRKLLEQGADPIHTPYPYSRTLVEQAVLNRDLPFLKLLIEFKVDVDCSGEIDSIDPQKLLELKNQNFSDGKLPIQNAVNFLLNNYFDEDAHEICRILFSVSPMAQAEYERVKLQSEKLYIELEERIKKEWDKAQVEGKRLMVLIGESHEAINPLLIQTIVANIFSTLVNPVTVLTEQDDKIFEYLDETGRRITCENKWGASLSLHHLIKKELKGSLIPVDQGHFGPASWDERRGWDEHSEAGIKYRNNIMSEESINQSTGNVIAVVGAAHEYGLINETNLSDIFNIVAINATGAVKENESLHAGDDEYRRQYINYLYSEHILQAAIISLNCKSLLTPEQAVEIARNVSQARVVAAQEGHVVVAREQLEEKLPNIYDLKQLKNRFANIIIDATLFNSKDLTKDQREIKNHLLGKMQQSTYFCSVKSIEQASKILDDEELRSQLSEYFETECLRLYVEKAARSKYMILSGEQYSAMIKEAKKLLESTGKSKNNSFFEGYLDACLPFSLFQLQCKAPIEQEASITSGKSAYILNAYKKDDAEIEVPSLKRSKIEAPLEKSKSNSADRSGYSCRIS